MEHLPDIPGDLPYFTSGEVAIHNKPNDLWVSILGRVYNLTELVAQHKGEKCIKPLLAFAGKDLSHMFDCRTGDIRYYVHPVTCTYVPYAPYGLLPDMQPVVPSSEWRPLSSPPWWCSSRYLVGRVSERSRSIRIIDMTTGIEHCMLVCREDSLRRIMERESKWNTEVESFTVKHEGRKLDMDLTLEENGIADDRELFLDIGMPAESFVPALCLYFNDDRGMKSE